MPNATRPIGLRGRPLASIRSTTASRCRCSHSSEQRRALSKGTVMTTGTDAKAGELKMRRGLPLATPVDLGAEAVRDLTAALNGVLAGVFALFLKTKNFHWHMSGPHFREYHPLFDEHPGQIFAIADR